LFIVSIASFLSKVPGLGRWRFVVVVTSVVVGNGRIDQLINIDAFEAIDAGNVEFAADLRVFSPCERADTAMPAIHMVDVVRLIVDEVRFPRQHPKSARVHLSAPQPRLGAHLAVAFECARAQINVRFKANGATVAASCVYLFQS